MVVSGRIVPVDDDVLNLAVLHLATIVHQPLGRAGGEGGNLSQKGLGFRLDTPSQGVAVPVVRDAPQRDGTHRGSAVGQTGMERGSFPLF